jgi:hypothetical protein
VSDPTRDPECTCPWVDESMWTTHYGAVEPASQREYDPGCPEHGCEPLLEAPAPCPKCGGAASWHGDEWSCYGACTGYGVLASPVESDTT